MLSSTVSAINLVRHSIASFASSITISEIHIYPDFNDTYSELSSQRSQMSLIKPTNWTFHSDNLYESGSLGLQSLLNCIELKRFQILQFKAMVATLIYFR